jgi:Rrf2 family nitric oxide-sensitive transcriptional repressor
VRLTTFSDYCLRVLMFVGAKADRLSTIDEIAASYGISRNHLTKVVIRLRQLGYLATVRGKGGGLRLGRPARQIGLGAVIRDIEDDIAPVSCLQKTGAYCVIEPACVLKTALSRATREFLRVLDEYTLEDLLLPRTRLARLLGVAA